MVKVTFNSALAQKEAKKGEPKSGEEALIIPHNAVAVDCKVRGPGGRRSGRWARGRAARGRCGSAPEAARGAGQSPGEGRALLFLGPLPLLVRRSFFVRKCVCRKRRLPRDRELGRPAGRRIGERCLVHGRWCSPGMCAGPGLGSVDLETGGGMQNNKNNSGVWHFLPV